MTTVQAPSMVRERMRALRSALDRPLSSYYLLLSASALLLTIGLIMVLSSSSVYAFRVYDGDSYAIVRRQLMWVGIGLPCAWVASRLPIRLVRALAWPAFGASVVMLTLTQVGLGREIGGNTNWLAVGPFQVQPAEVAKLAIVLWAAHIYANKERRLAELAHVLIPVVPGLLLITGLVIWGRDLGTALVMMGILLAMLWVVGAPARLFAFAFTALGVAAFALAGTSSVRVARIMTFTDPFKDYLATGWQPAHGLFALTSGGIFGKGIGASQQKWGQLPAAHTDFVFAVLGEELGLVGTSLVVLLFGVIAFAAIRVALRTEEPFIRYATFGIVAWLSGQMVINVGMVLTLLPVIGIPLPLLSFGGSSLVPTLVALGLLVGFARREPEAALALAARRRTRAVGLSGLGRRAH
ncbi:putative lipid II flippase FtsW [Nocardioides limicola]|uniref:putative lipid II flippase FtsW n=1 Tax=Nocardioides limicola TaxID=2803368 RepID=UPI0027DB8DD3|nr:putative lipid II flippase FtsW [Nocardioides sp. DJM-14]